MPEVATQALHLMAPPLMALHLMAPDLMAPDLMALSGTPS